MRVYDGEEWWLWWSWNNNKLSWTAIWYSICMHYEYRVSKRCGSVRFLPKISFIYIVIVIITVTKWMWQRSNEPQNSKKGRARTASGTCDCTTKHYFSLSQFPEKYGESEKHNVASCDIINTRRTRPKANLCSYVTYISNSVCMFNASNSEFPSAWPFYYYAMILVRQRARNWKWAELWFRVNRCRKPVWKLLHSNRHSFSTSFRTWKR